jgi:hypothetical protein
MHGDTKNNTCWIPIDVTKTFQTVCSFDQHTPRKQLLWHNWEIITFYHLDAHTTHVVVLMVDFTHHINSI